MNTSPSDGAEGAVGPLQKAGSGNGSFLNFTPMVSTSNVHFHYGFLFPFFDTFLPEVWQKFK